MNTAKKHASLFELDGIPKMSQAIPLALQHVVAMIVGCVTPAIIISGAAGIDTPTACFNPGFLVVSARQRFCSSSPSEAKTAFISALPFPLSWE